MSAVFLKLVSMSLAAGWMILAVALLRLLLRNAPKGLRCALWGLVALRLLCPVSLESSLSLIPKEVGNGSLVTEWAEGYVEETWTIPDSSVHYDAAVAAGREPVPAGDGSYYVVAKADQLGEPASVEDIVLPILSWVWLVGMALLLLYAAAGYWRLHRRVALAAWLRGALWVCDEIDTPFILGVFRPRIYLPSAMGEEELAYVEAHEKAHLRRRDHWWKPLGFGLLAVYWFNPLVWMAYILLCRDIELACDERVVKELGEENKRAYSQALLSCSMPRRLVTACPLAFGEVGVGARVKSVLSYKKPAFWLLGAAAAACIVLAVCFLTNPYSEELQVNGQVYVRQGDAVETLPEGSVELGSLERIVHRTQEHPEGDFSAVNLEEKYAGNKLFQSGAEADVVYLEDLGGLYLPFHRAGGTDGTGAPGRLTLDDVISLAEKGEALTWTDFEGYSYIETGSGLYIRVYEIDEMFSLAIGGAGPESEPMYIYLGSSYSLHGRIDIRSGNVEAFIEDQERGRTEYLKDNDPLPDGFPAGFLLTGEEGTWSTTLRLYPDGTFEGSYTRSDAEDTGEGYPNGTHSSCEFTGRFAPIRRLDAHTFSLTLAELTPAQPEGGERIEDGVRFAAAHPYGLTGGETFFLYTPEAPLDSLDEEFLRWRPDGGRTQGQEGAALSCYGLYNENTGAGFFGAADVGAQREPAAPEEQAEGPEPQLPAPEGLTLWLERPVYDPSVERYTYFIRNDTEQPTETFGEPYTVQRLENGTWRELDWAGGAAFTSIGYQLQPGGVIALTCWMGSFTQERTPGIYRLVKEVGAHTLYAEFALGESIYTAETPYGFLPLEELPEKYTPSERDVTFGREGLQNAQAVEEFLFKSALGAGCQLRIVQGLGEVVTDLLYEKKPDGGGCFLQRSRQGGAITEERFSYLVTDGEQVYLSNGADWESTLAYGSRRALLLPQGGGAFVRLAEQQTQGRLMSNATRYKVWSADAAWCASLSYDPLNPSWSSPTEFTLIRFQNGAAGSGYDLQDWDGLETAILGMEWQPDGKLRLTCQTADPKGEVSVLDFDPESERLEAVRG